MDSISIIFIIFAAAVFIVAYLYERDSPPVKAWDRRRGPRYRDKTTRQATFMELNSLSDEDFEAEHKLLMQMTDHTCRNKYGLDVFETLRIYKEVRIKKENAQKAMCVVKKDD